MQFRHKGAAALAVAVALLSSAGAVAAGSPSPAEVAAERQASLRAVLNIISWDAIHTQRLTCFFGEEPDRVAAARRAGQTFRPDAADLCVAVLVRSAHDGKLYDLYQTVLREQGGDMNLVEQLPTIVGKAALREDRTLALGNGRTMDVAPTMAFDAGFTLAYLHNDSSRANADPAQLKAVAESCFDVKTLPGTCFAAGYAEGGKALTMDPMALFSR